MDFTFYFKKRDWTLIGEYFYKKSSEKATDQEICLRFDVNMPEAQI